MRHPMNKMKKLLRNLAKSIFKINLKILEEKFGFSELKKEVIFSVLMYIALSSQR